MQHMILIFPLLMFTALLCIFIVRYIIKDIKKNGFLCGNMAISVFLLFYVAVPLAYLIFDEARDTTTVFNMLLAKKNMEDICLSMFFCAVIVFALCVLYKTVYRNKKPVYAAKLPVLYRNTVQKNKWKQLNQQAEKRIAQVADVCFVLGGVSIVACIFAVGGISKYLALGSMTRGLDKNVTDYISGSMLPLITLSVVILVTPYLYLYLMRISSKKYSLKVRFWVSMVISIIYLLYNQGRLPLMLFLIPFIVDSKLVRRAKITTILALMVVCILLLEPLQNLFTYLSYGVVYQRESSGVFEKLLLEFTYPFANFINRKELIGEIGFRFGLDFVQWPLMIIPNSLLKIIGLSKTGIESIGSLNTDAYSALVRTKAGGGIPVDILTFGYYQFGILSMILGVALIAFLLRTMDRRLIYLNDNEEAGILRYRICFLLISLINNFDPSVIVRTRIDFIILIIIVFFIARKGRLEDECKKNC